MYNGMLNIRKEPGYTSADVVAKLRGILHMRRIGHTGTLDPAAEGVLPVCLGSATKLCDHIADRDKVYETVMRLGVTTDTEDMTGQILTEMSGGEVRRRVTEEALRETVQSFAGDYAQIPPMYSAIKVGG
ncbi:MAG: tRNA pseudouridine(55) synthase, partial [Lachnospiraceae bacterium]|nr:tRNA pseudouridine(55) synthase [Lachnospiraceae bacterium]